MLLNEPVRTSTDMLKDSGGFMHSRPDLSLGLAQLFRTPNDRFLIQPCFSAFPSCTANPQH